MGEGGAAGDKPVEIRSINIRVTQGADGLKGLIVREQEENVWLPVPGSGDAGKQCA